MELSYTITGQEARIDKVLEPGVTVALPEELEGCSVTELGAYALSGSSVEEVHLPSGLRRIGAYAFYGCGSLRRIYCYGRALDLGTGLFAGVGSVELLDITEFEGEKSCFKEMLSELRQTLRVRVRRIADGGTGLGAGIPGGAGLSPAAGAVSEARLIFPEYYEESVENTPARILFIETHGCGHRYRYCFVNREFQYGGYDELFPHVKVQEPEELVTELAIGRLAYPCGLSVRHRQMYQDYVREHWLAAGRLMIAADRFNGGAVTNLEPGGLPWLVEGVLDNGEPKGFSEARVNELAMLAQKAGDTEMVGWLMDYRHKKHGAGQAKRRKFEL